MGEPCGPLLGTSEGRRCWSEAEQILSLRPRNRYRYQYIVSYGQNQEWLEVSPGMLRGEVDLILLGPH